MHRFCLGIVDYTTRAGYCKNRFNLPGINENVPEFVRLVWSVVQALPEEGCLLIERLFFGVLVLLKGCVTRAKHINPATNTQSNLPAGLFSQAVVVTKKDECCRAINFDLS